MHERGCSCHACHLVREWIGGFKAGGQDGHPQCCVCPLCAAPREVERRIVPVETSTFGEMYHREIQRSQMAVNRGLAWWMNTVDTASTDYGPNPFYQFYAPGEIDPIEKIEQPQDAVDAFDLLHEMGIPIREADKP